MLAVVVVVVIDAVAVLTITHTHSVVFKEMFTTSSQLSQLTLNQQAISLSLLRVNSI